MLELLDQEVEEHAHLRDLLRPRREHGKDRWPSRYSAGWREGARARRRAPPRATRKSASLAMPAPCSASCRMHCRLSLAKVAGTSTCSTPPSSALNDQRPRPGAVKTMQRCCARSAGRFGTPKRSRYCGLAMMTGSISVTLRDINLESLERPHAHGDVDLLGIEVHDPVREGQVDAHVGIAAMEVHEHRCQVAHAHGDRRVDAQQPARVAGRGGHLLLEAIDGFDQAPTGVEVGLALRRQRQLARRAVDEPHAEPLLQAPHQLRDRRRRQAQIARRDRKRAALDCAHEHAHLRQLLHVACLRLTHAAPSLPTPVMPSPKAGQDARRLLPGAPAPVQSARSRKSRKARTFGKFCTPGGNTA